MTVCEQLRILLREHRGKFHIVAQESGVSASTVRKIHGGFIKNPKIETVEALMRWLTKRTVSE